MKKPTFYLLLLMCLPFWVSAAHIIGGELTYTCEGGGNYDFILTMYRDCSNPDAGNFDQNAIIGVYRGIGADAELVDAFPVGLVSIDPLEITQTDPCAVPPPGFCSQVGVYNFSYLIEDWPSTEPYTFVYQRCCRNNTISNIQTPWDTGISFVTEISPASQAVCNNSPYFESIPPTLICLNEDVNYFHLATDDDGDQLVYEFCAPFAGGGDNGGNGCNSVIPNPPCPPPFNTVNFQAPYTSSQPMLGSPTIGIDANTGYISGVPTALGQFVLGICVSEYRNGVLLGTTRRDIQLNVAVCTPVVTADVEDGNEINGLEYFELCLNDNAFTFSSEVAINLDNVSIEWYFEDPQEFYSEELEPTFTFDSVGTYTGHFVVIDDGGCRDSAFMAVDVYQHPIPDFSFYYDSCVAGPVFYENLSVEGDAAIESFVWDLGDAQITDTWSPTYFYTEPGLKDLTLSLLDENGCTEEIQGEILYQPAPAVIVLKPPAEAFCPPAFVEIDNLSFPVDSTYEVVWNFGDGTDTTALAVEHLYEEVGTYDISISITSPIGCQVDSVFEQLIEVQDPPVADLNIVGEAFTNLNNELGLENNAQNYIGYQWFVNGDYVPTGDFVTYELRDTGLVEIMMAVQHPLGCVDTTYRYIDVAPENRVFFPNAFSPNGDAVNDEFKPTGVYLGLYDYQLEVYDRWGSLIFQTTDIKEGWNGTHNNDGRDTPNDSYTYFVRYTEPRGAKISLQGMVTIIR
jgi:gliding motility-associated-like protein